MGYCLGVCVVGTIMSAQELFGGIGPVNALATVPAGTNKEKRIIFVRHGCTYMNEYLGRHTAFGAPSFSDIFPSEERHKYFQDSPLSNTGVRQAKALAASKPSFVSDCELVVTSPLRRALQTLDIGLKPHLLGHRNKANAAPPIIALPEAAERLYLVSDIGRPVREIQKEYEYMDFETGFQGKPKDAWWYQSPGKSYSEWRPSGRGQKYACPGEPQDDFADRMARLYRWLHDRAESRIVVICHWGVIDWMIDQDYDNCQWGEVTLSQIRSRISQPDYTELWQRR